MSVRLKTWTREEYDRLVARGAFAPGARVQLIDGEIVEMTPQGTRHAAALLRVLKVLEKACGTDYVVRPQMPVALSERSEPEPDVAVVSGSIDDYRDHHPSTATLVVEIADTTLDFDRTRKLALYAAAGIPEYWILNLVERVLEIYREPRGPAYHDVSRLPGEATVTPLCASGARIGVTALLP